MFFSSCTHHQKRRFSRPESNFPNHSKFAVPIEHRTSDQVADVIPSWFELRPVFFGNLQLGANQRLGIGNRINPFEFQNQVTFVRPKAFNLQLAALPIVKKRQQVQALLKPARHITVQLDCNLAVSALRFHYAGQRDEFAGDS